jgi:hypothetical protein
MKKIKTKIILLLLIEIIFIPLIIFFVAYALSHKTDFPSCHIFVFTKVAVFYSLCLTIISFTSLILALIGIKFFEKSLVKCWVILSVMSFAIGTIIYFVSIANTLIGNCLCGCLMN